MKLPQKFYVARQYRGSEEILGFMVVADNESTKGFEKKKASADRWASYQNKMEPIYVDNEPKKGFHMVTNVSRYSTSNVLWRIRHPEGFEFEITSANMCDLLATNTIINGEFQDEMFFTENRQLVNTKTQLFADMIEKQEKAEALKEAAKALEPGNAFRIDGHPNIKDVRYRYMGKLHAINVGYNAALHTSEKSSLFHVIHNVTNNEYYLRTKMDFEFIRLDYLDIDVVKEELVRDVNHYFENEKSVTNYLYDYKKPLVVHHKPFKKKDLIIEYKDVSTAGLTIHDHRLYKLEHKGEPQRVFGFSFEYKDYRNSRTVGFSTTNERNATDIHFYKAVLEETGQLSIDVDLSKHYGLSGYYAQSPFHRISERYYGTDKPHLSSIKIPDTIQEGTYKVGE